MDSSSFDELSAYTLVHPDASFIHQEVVDAYTAQTATPETRPITLAFALIGLYLFLEKHYTGKQVQRVHTRLAALHSTWPSFTLPLDRGALTAATVLAAPPGKERDQAIHEWCVSVWNTYAESHEDVARLAHLLY